MLGRPKLKSQCRITINMKKSKLMEKKEDSKIN